MEIDRGYLGYALLQRGFRDWFLYCFRAINGTPFVVSPIHEDLFEQIQNIIDGKDTRVNINLCPRSGKTTIAMWLTVYALTVNPKAQIIYTSYSQDLLGQVSKQVASILAHPIYTAMYSNNIRAIEQEEDPVDDFWRNYLIRTTGKPVYSTRKIVTGQGGIVLFSAIGGQITGFGAGIRGAKGFSGILIVDDANKVSDSRSQKMMVKTQEYFVDTLFTRLNNSDTPIANIQQRVHQDDLSGYLAEVYHFKTFKFPLLAEDGTCNLSNQYTEERIAELKLNNYVFNAQYQQEPIPLGGGMIKHEWWRYYDKDYQSVPFRKLFITADTAFKTNEWNDFTAIGMWGMTMNNRLYLIDLLHGKFEAPELEAMFMSLWNKWNKVIQGKAITSIYIEDKASGTGLIQSLRRKGGLPIMGVQPNSDKRTRVLEAIPQIAAGNVLLPFSENSDISKKVLAEADAFSDDMSHAHDDIVDMVCYAIQYGFSQRGLF